MRLERGRSGEAVGHAARWRPSGAPVVIWNGFASYFSTMPGEIYAGVRPSVTSAREPPHTLAWLALTVAAAAAAGVILGRGEVRLGILPVAALLVLIFAGVPAAGYVAILWSVGTFVDMLAPPEVTISWLRFAPAEILLWIALGSLAFLPRDVRRALRALPSGARASSWRCFSPPSSAAWPWASRTAQACTPRRSICG